MFQRALVNKSTGYVHGQRYPAPVYELERVVFTYTDPDLYFPRLILQVPLKNSEIGKKKFYWCLV